MSNSNNVSDSNRLMLGSNTHGIKEGTIPTKVNDSGRRLFNPLKAKPRSKSNVAGTGGNVYSSVVSRAPSLPMSSAVDNENNIQNVRSQLSTLTLKMYSFKEEIKSNFSSEISVALSGFKYREFI
jgi:hypothetical protein